MNEFWSERIKHNDVYVPGEQLNDKKYIKLNTNENPYPPSKRVIQAIKKAADGRLRLYPDPDCRELRKKMSGYYGIPEEQIFVGNGSDEVLAFAFAAFFDPGKPILFPDITYSFYPVYANIFKLRYTPLELKTDFSVPVEKFLRDNNGIILPNPNAPTSKYLPVKKIREMVEYNLGIKKVVIVDEAYIDFGGASCAGLIRKYPNLLVVQTLSKSRSLAGLRVGAAFGQKPLIEGLNKVKGSINSYTVDSLAIAGAGAAFEDDKYFESTRGKIIATRKRVSEQLRKMGFKVLDSKSNFLFLTHKNIKGEELFRRLKAEGVLVRYFNQPRIENYIRVSIGTDKEMKEFVARTALIVKGK